MTSSVADAVSEAIARADLDGLVRLVERFCRERDWEAVVLLRDRARAALERGLQMWPAAEYAEYRLALDAPGPFAGPVVREGAGRFALGPLWEVAASSHSWEALALHIPAGPTRSLAAHERVLRGEDLSGEADIDRGVLEIPLVLQAWEPGYALAVFRAAEADFPSPPPVVRHEVALPPAGPSVEDDQSVEALLALARPWEEESNGRVKAVVVEGRAEEAVAAMAGPQVLAAEITPSTALAWMAWAAASGGAYGRRRGGAAGRGAAWWAVASLAGLDWPVAPVSLGAALAAMRWLSWEPPEFRGGWGLHLAGEVPGEGLAFAVAAEDSRREEPAVSG